MSAHGFQMGRGNAKWLLFLLISFGLKLCAQNGALPDKIEHNVADTLWQLVKYSDSDWHWNTLQNDNVTFTGIVCSNPRTDVNPKRGEKDDCDSTFNLYIANNKKVQLILQDVINRNRLPICINTTYIHVEVICLLGDCIENCRGKVYSGIHTMPDSLDSVSVTGKLIVDKHGRCQFEIHPAYNIFNYGPSNVALPHGCCRYGTHHPDCNTLSIRCPPE